MKVLLATLAGLLPLSLAGCGTQKVLLGTEGHYLLTTMDEMVLPGKSVSLTARVQAGDLLRPQVGCVVRFYRDGCLYRVTETDQEGLGSVRFRPDRPGDFPFEVVISPVGLRDTAPAPQTLRVCCRAQDAPLVIVDLDKTIVADGFHAVLLGNPEPADHSPPVMQRLAQTHTIVYLTHRPDYFSKKSKTWIEQHGFPPGPVLLSSLSGFLKGSEAFKSERIAELRRRFTRLEIGIGDKFSDALAYHQNVLKAYLLVQLPSSSRREDWESLLADLETLPPEIQVVRDWHQIDAALFRQASYPPAATIEFVREQIRRLSQTNAASMPNDQGVAQPQGEQPPRTVESPGL
ncbi:MAG: hypothetical protein JW810_07965 [Sedimentisphaerales bacterium]|nr:hypothetical protein [Sedimentisphaerales bacterium]